MGALQLSPEIEKADAEDQQCPAGMEAHGTVAEVCVAAGLLGVIHVLMDIRTGKCACFCHGRLLAWGCWKQRAESHLLRPTRPKPGPMSKHRPPPTSSSKGHTARGQEGQTQVVTRNRAQNVIRFKAQCVAKIKD